MSTREELARLLWAEIAASGLRQCEIAAEADITEKHLSQMLHGKVGVNPDLLDRIMAALGRRVVVGTVLVNESAMVDYGQQAARGDAR